MLTEKKIIKQIMRIPTGTSASSTNLDRAAPKAAKKDESLVIAKQAVKQEDFTQPMSEIENLISKKYEIKSNVLSNTREFYVNSEKVEIKVNDLMRWLWANGIKIRESGLNVILESSFVKSYNPINEYFDSLKWDNIDHIDKLLSYIETTDTTWFRTQLTKHLVRCVAQAKGHSAFNKHCLVFIGAQNNGKTSLVRFFCPPQLQKYIKQDPGTNKDGIIALAQNFILVYDELSQLSRMKQDAVKAMMTLDNVNERLPYARKNQIMKRNANFFATTNYKEFLTDETGNVRWIPICINRINHDNGKANGYVQCDINGIWAQALALFNQGYEYNLTPDELQYLDDSNKNHIQPSYEMELILQQYDIGTKDEHDSFLTAAEITNILSTQRKVNYVQIGKALKFLGFTKVAKWDSKEQRKRDGYFLKVKRQR